MVKFRVCWWFKHRCKGSSEPITSILLNLRDFCVEKARVKPLPNEEWFPLGIYRLKFNMDSSSRGKPGHAGIGGVLRNSDGKIICLFSFYVGIEDSNMTEILTIHKVFELCTSRTDLMGRDIIIVNDSKAAVS
ncbi:hypothetical protein Dsin_005591 [Dipteronia sinensis]|uniref:RNase H type-1 domain-containing protein n=1 Tax=Dipteronia sinensis TaxID=43782 RepID=A0AAE0EF24_9ROSI|nr:hypothetical protein Dsin_005591 [Dipteronia sinensis]